MNASFIPAQASVVNVHGTLFRIFLLCFETPATSIGDGLGEAVVNRAVQIWARIVTQ